MSERNLTLLLLLLQAMGGAVTFFILTSCPTPPCQSPWSPPALIHILQKGVSNSGWPLLDQDCFPAQASPPFILLQIVTSASCSRVTTDILGLSCPLKTTAWTLPMAFLNLPLSFSILFCSLLRQNTVVFMQLSTTLTLKEYVGPGNRTLVGDRDTSSKMAWHLAVICILINSRSGVRCSQWWQ